MRRNAYIVRSEPAVEPQDALFPDNLLEAIHHALVRQRPIGRPRLLLQPRLHKIERQGEEASEEASSGTRRQRLRAGSQRRVLEAGFGFGEEGQLAEVERHGAHDGGRAAGPQPGHALVARDADQRVERRRVVCALRGRLEPVGLHADQGQVGRVADHGGETARREPGARAVREPDRCAFCLGARGQRFHEGVEEAYSRRRVDGLAEQARAEARVQVHDFAAGDDVPEDGDGGWFGARFDALAGELEADFDHVDGLDDGGCCHAC